MSFLTMISVSGEQKKNRKRQRWGLSCIPLESDPTGQRKDFLYCLLLTVEKFAATFL